MSIKTKTIALLVLSLFISGLIMGGAGMFVLYRQTFNSLEVAMNNQSVQLAAQVSDLFDAFDKSGKAYGADAELQSGDPGRIQARINTYFETSWGIDRLNFIDPTGRRTAIAPYDSKILGDSLTDRDFVQNTMKDQKSHISDVIINRATGVPSIVVTQPVRAQTGQMAGMVLQAINLDTLQNFLEQVKIGSTGAVAIVARDGSLIVHSNKALVKEQKKIPADQIKRLTEQSGHLGSFIDLTDRESVALSVPVRNTDWFVVASLPTKEVKDGFYASLIWMAVSLGAGLIVIGVIGWRFLLKTLRPVEALVEEASKIAEGNLAISALDIDSDDEVGRLSKSFEMMTKNLRSIMLQVSQAIEKVAASSEELTANAEQSARAADQVAQVITDVADGAEKQLKAVDDTSVVVQQMAAGVQQIAANATLAAGTSAKTAAAAQEGSKALDNAIGQMSQIEATVARSAEVVTTLGERSKEIGQIIDTMSAIASQTNLLALNAAIEAARAVIAVRSEIDVEMNKHMVAAAKLVAEILECKPDMDGDTIRLLMDTAGLEEVWITDADGVVALSNIASGIGFRFPEKGQAGEFRTILSDSSLVVTQPAMQRDLDGQIYKYVGVGRRDQRGIVQIGVPFRQRDVERVSSGFAVVADEVRKLAEQSQKAAKQIAGLIAKIQKDTDSAVVSMNAGTREVRVGTAVINNAGMSFREIFGLIGDVTNQVRQISAAIEELAGGSQQIVTAVRDIEIISKGTADQSQTVSAATEEQSATMEEIAASSQALAKMAAELTGAVSKFKM